jgi:SAM-dependent methyltransferase
VTFQYSGKDNLDLMSLSVRYNSAIYEWLIKGLGPEASVLDFGAGKGEFCNRLLRYKIKAVELDEDMHASILCPAFRDVSSLTEKFDLIYSVNVLEHIDDDSTTIKQFGELLRPNGTIKIFVPARQELYSNMDRTVGHLRRYSMDSMKRLVSDNGFQIVSCRYFDFAGYFASLLYKLMNRESVFNAQTVLFYDRVIFPVSHFFDFITLGKVIGKNIILEARKA